MGPEAVRMIWRSEDSWFYWDSNSDPLGRPACSVALSTALPQPLTPQTIVYCSYNSYVLNLGCLHPVACTTSGSGFPCNATLFE
jgi:hypothetical protein